ncbi:alpha/beta-Hydrolases superfamily protein [Arabidopsis thaliana]|jgi:pimeloyl-ACP methyl ester carboxylesterase|uniref:Isoform 2 of Probable lysophospholipase BODYGUARD 4 n=1 Tax=Arabidopsis thaliana TaxID=3702 RepID=Q700D5-2|nr:alpha/beta-Hydrolases superfamily protein [Arabidopsis thaliana]AED92468.1 alpha/beta-Hydrolases superfamily protein [Arabidopsis thaliana]|eukprot:NP_001119241.1 alpha/beta-Hydrolases superfamily protein [Arabidopsis thaliana]
MSFPRKFGTAIHAALSFIVFFFLDLLDAILCVVYEFVDEILEENSTGCYCTAAAPQSQTTDENELSSETLFGRRNIFRGMWFLGFAREFKSKLSRKLRKSKIHQESVNRWSDCGCKSCKSWTKNEDGNLHVVVKDSTSRETEYSVQEPSENVIFIHGFMGSSHFWTETVFEHIQKDDYRLLAIDLLGFGESPKPRDSLYTLKDHVDTIERSVIKPYQLDSFHVVAHSMGCLIALALAAKHSNIVKSVTLVAPPYFPSSVEGSVLNRIARKRLWPPLAFGTAVMSWYEHIGRCVCFIICKHHKIWEWLIKLCIGKREIHWKIKDITRHTHHSAWHSMHNVICGGSKVADEHLETLIKSGVKIHLMQGDCDQIVPSHCSGNMKRTFPAVEVDIITGADHDSMISGRGEEFAEKLESIWCSC